MATHYKTLGIDPLADPKAVKKAWRDLIKDLHPDRHEALGLTEKQREKATKKFQRVQRAYEVLRDEGSRRTYDRNLTSRRERKVRQRAARAAKRAQTKEARAEAARLKKWYARQRTLAQQEAARRAAVEQVARKPRMRAQAAAAGRAVNSRQAHEARDARRAREQTWFEKQQAMEREAERWTNAQDIVAGQISQQEALDLDALAGKLAEHLGRGVVFEWLGIKK